MKCMNCGAELTSSVYCPKCGCDVSVQKQAIILSGIYYNQGLEKAQVRDLSGTIDQLKRSLKFNKLNIPARNLLGGAVGVGHFQKYSAGRQYCGGLYPYSPAGREPPGRHQPDH